MEKNLWAGEIGLPEDNCTPERVASLIEAMALSREDLNYVTDHGAMGITFDPQGPSSADGCAGYYDEAAVVKALAALHANGDLTATYVEGPFEKTIFECLGDGQVRAWEQAEAFTTKALPHVVMLGGGLYELDELEGGRIPNYILEEAEEANE